MKIFYFEHREGDDALFAYSEKKDKEEAKKDLIELVDGLTLS